MPKLVICSSVSYYPELVGVRKEFQVLGFDVTVPSMVDEIERATSDAEVAEILKGEVTTLEIKLGYIREYFAQIEKGDLVLAYNRSKRGFEGYIGPNVLMELSLGLYLHKKLFLWETPSPQLNCVEEVLAMAPVILNCQAKNLKKFTSFS